jgi:predicted unusual protein kinase regulating ubiquinone biosynthesis (AarF/ABC1/UbiB family)
MDSLRTISCPSHLNPGHDAAQGVYVPDMMVEHTTQRVLVMEWVEGRRLRREGSNGQGPTPEELQEDLKLVEVGVQCSLEQARSSWPIS